MFSCLSFVEKRVLRSVAERFFRVQMQPGLSTGTERRRKQSPGLSQFSQSLESCLGRPSLDRDRASLTQEMAA
jgi:hypothetical protein